MDIKGILMWIILSGHYVCTNPACVFVCVCMSENVLLAGRLVIVKMLSFFFVINIFLMLLLFYYCFIILARVGNY